MSHDMKELAEVFAVIGIGGAAITAFILLTIYVVVPLLRGVGNGIGFTFSAIGWFFSHIFEFISGVIGNLLRFVGSLIAMLVLIPLVPLNIVIGRWSAAGHFAERVKGECKIGSTCVYRALVHHPLKLVMLHGILEGLEQRVPEAMNYAPGADSPGRRVGQFDGYSIVGSLRAGGSGAKLYIAEPDDSKRRKIRGIPNRVVIKCFALTEGSSLPQIVRESRALECAKQLGHVFDHGMDQHRFFYVMPYHPGDHLGLITRQLHGECGSGGLDQKRLHMVLSYANDLIATLSAYHKGGLWHKDVKPENVIVHDGRAHLVDLGLVTPLRSAMTLTTHGTEYFRDPEMVRQALRGVKVHQVDGAKFDIYGVGAVLYFMVENTFPAHGGLSRFVTNSPESMRWIIRRAMTEYHQRYATADEMLADLEYVARASDAFAIKPADLPSMRGSDAPSVDLDSERSEVVAAAGSPASRNDAVEGFGIAAGIGGAGPFAQVGHFKVDGEGRPMPTDAKSPSKKPRLKVTNWWTGEYKVEESVQPIASPTVEQEACSFRDHAYAFRDEAEKINRQAQIGAMSARKAAREQIKAARQRAREIRDRALTHRHRVKHARPRGSGWAVAIGALSLCLITGLISIAFLVASVSSRVERSVGSARISPGRPVLLVVDAANPDDARVRAKLQQVIEQRQRQGYDVIIDRDVRDNELTNLIEQWQKNKKGPADEAIERILEDRNLYGLLHVQVEGDRRNAARNVSEQIVMSTRPGAEHRRRVPVEPVPAPPQSELAYLLINDHPAKADAQVMAKIDQLIKAYHDKGWNIRSDVDAEVTVRNYLPSGPIDADVELSPMLHAMLAQAKLAGVLKIDALQGDRPPQERIGITRIDAKPIPADLADDDSAPSSMANEIGAVESTALVGASR
jgi:serine/threonine protein kinase